jgi:enoyl-CoA hydratase
MTATIHTDFDGRIATVRLDAPRKHNVLSLDGWRALAEALRTLDARDDLGCVIVRGTGGRAFSAGSDIGAFGEQRSAPDDVRSYSEAIAGAMEAVRGCRHPTLAAIEGLCVGGGLEIAACCDLRVCEESSRFGAPINRLGLTMSHEELTPLVGLLGQAVVLEILLTGDLIDAARAREVGLVNWVAADGEAIATAREVAGRVAAGAPLVNRWHKKFIRRLSDPAPLTEEERGEAHATFETEDYREGRDAFLAKRPPRFEGR